MVQTAKLQKIRSCRSSMVVDFPVVVQRSIPMVLLFSRTMVIPRLQFLNEVIDVPVMQAVRVILGSRRAEICELFTVAVPRRC